MVNAPALPAGNTRPDKRFGDSAGVVPRPGVLVVAFEPPGLNGGAGPRLSTFRPRDPWVGSRAERYSSFNPDRVSRIRTLAEPCAATVPGEGLRPQGPGGTPYTGAITPMILSSHLARRVGAARPELCR